MPLSVRPKIYSLPSYSLTGDLLGYLRCGLQYRYTRIGQLPSTRPVQLWFGQFIHGVLEEAYRRYKESMAAGSPSLPPWDQTTREEIRTLIKDRLAAQGLFPWSADLEQLGDARADVAIQELAPHLFPIIHRAEIRLTGARLLPPIQSQLQFREADRYEMVGVIDVVTHIQLCDPTLVSNPIVQAIIPKLPKHLPPAFEVILDYKGMRRPPFTQATSGAPGLWEQYAWQLQTYGHLRRQQADALPVAAGVLIYLNELLPTRGDLERLKREITAGTSDVIPAAGSEAEQRLRSWNPRQDPPTLPLDFRLARALRVLPITADSIMDALYRFDAVVQHIETCRGREVHGTLIRDAWERNASDESTCTVCDSRTFCPDYLATYAHKTGEMQPRLPAVRA